MSHLGISGLGSTYVLTVVCLGILGLGGTCAPALMNSAEETLAIAELVMACTDCESARIAGSTNLQIFTYFAFSDEYIPATSVGE